ncbi:MAG: ATP-binding protein [Microscillaceae bacterium]|nr:ATP-binding protein [Microscillaceae bacterium]
MKKRFFLIIYITFLTHFAFAQCSKIDSLERILVFTNGLNQKVNILNELSENYKNIGEIQRAYSYARQSISLARNIQYELGEARALKNKAAVSYAVNPQSIDEATEAFEKALKIYKKQKKDLELADTFGAYGRFYQETSYTQESFLDSAALYYKEAYQIYEQKNELPKAAEIASNIAEVYFEKGDDEQAFEYSKKSINSNDTQFSNARIVQKFLDKQSAQQRRFIYFLIGGLVLMAFLSILLVRGMMQIGQANKLLRDQKADLVQKNHEIDRQNKEIEQKNIKIQDTLTQLQIRNREIDKQYKQILLQQEEIEMRNVELSEKNEELKQTQEEIKAQRDNLSKQAHEMSIQAEELQKSHETITILSRIGQSITSTLNFKDIFDTFYGYVTQLMPADGFRVSEYHPEYGELEYKFNTENQKKKPLIKVRMQETSNPAVWCVKNARSIMINRKSDLLQYGLDEYSINPMFNSMIYFPLLNEDHTIGAVGVYSKLENAYNQHHMDMIKTLASYTSIALKNAKTYEILNAAQEQLVESEKMAALGGLVAGVAHEINTPVGICVTAASRLDTKTKEFKELFITNQMKRKHLVDYLETNEQGNKIILSNLTRAADLVQGFKRVAVEQSSETKRLFNLKTYLEETILALNPEFKNKPYEIILEAQDDIEINSYAGAFSQIITNLVMNSLIHGFKNRDSGQIRITVHTRYNNVYMTYTDNGNGMTEEVKNKIFEPFFTTNRDGGGTGLGMNIVYNLVVQKLGGKINLESIQGKGVLFTFEIPANTVN